MIIDQKTAKKMYLSGKTITAYVDKNGTTFEFKANEKIKKNSQERRFYKIIAAIKSYLDVNNLTFEIEEV